MKNLLFGAMILLAFSFSVLIIQSSCSKSNAQSANVSQLNKLIYTTYDHQIWIADYDGTNRTQVNLILPTDIIVDVSYPRFSVKISPDGQKIFFSGINTVTRDMAIYSADISGNNVTLILAGSPGINQPDQPILCGAY